MRQRQRHDRALADRRLGDIDRRLRAHDVALGLDTQPTSVGSLDSAPVPPSIQAGHTAASEGGLGEECEMRVDGERVWYVSNDSRTRSAVPAGQLRDLYRDGHIGAETLVWTDGMRDWRALCDVPDLEEALRG